MTPEQLHYTRVIAEFMGWVFVPNSIITSNEYPNSYYRHPNVSYGDNLKNMRYNRSYDWLHEAWVKFRDLPISELESTGQSLHHNLRVFEVAHTITHKSIDEAFELLAKAIEWYNSLKK